MQKRRRLVNVTGFALYLAVIAPAHADPVDISGKWGDSNGRLGCMTDNEYLSFDSKGSVTTPEGATLTYNRDRNMLTLNLENNEKLILKIVNTGTMEIAAFLSAGKPNPEATHNWVQRHGTFKRCL